MEDWLLVTRRQRPERHHKIRVNLNLKDASVDASSAKVENTNVEPKAHSIENI